MGLNLRLEGIKVVKGGRQVLAVDELYIAGGEVWGLLGPNGAGKSTLLQVVALLERPDQGRLYFDGEPIIWRRRELLRLRRRLSLVFQEPLLLSTTVYQNVALGLRFRGMEEKEISRRVEGWLKLLGLSHLASRYPWELSGGEARKVSLARALVLEPHLLLLDEPFTGLDLPTRTLFLEELRRIVKERNITVLFVTHDYTELPLLADRVVLLSEGRILSTGRPEDLVSLLPGARSLPGPGQRFLPFVTIQSGG
ncbi:tungstate transport system ATP-binding protein [Thermanaeromonas toyohensis ToBE]|uniref:Tungstate transport system ATP-binding protein n=1 Tax=Thermanaeromonas toyohensis ToBE TaxID=698762 RepID=A0A1W1V7T1_9FIRM|nr:ATP-binding cassette domain-containing protein [Thermanaeromonas toyohensis]SMB89402.1 tungstate transport system ATP-binding protein [Thermanaeromonas toyohensis ToBE]